MRHDSNSVTATVVAMALGALLLADSAFAQEDTPPDHPMMSDRFFMGAGALWAESNVTANLNTGRVGLGTFIDFEDDMGLDENKCDRSVHVSYAPFGALETRSGIFQARSRQRKTNQPHH